MRLLTEHISGRQIPYFRNIRIPYRRIIYYLTSCTVEIYLPLDWILSWHIWNNIFGFGHDVASITLLPKVLLAAVDIFACGILTEGLWKIVKNI